MQAGLFALIPKDRLTGILDTFHALTGLPLRLIDLMGASLYRCGQDRNYCAALRTQIFPGQGCEDAYCKAGKRASQLGEAYLFTCHGELTHIAFPLMDQGELLASVIAGPFLMEQPDSTMVSVLLEKYPLTPALSLELYDGLMEMPVEPPARVHLLERLLDHLLSPLLPAERSRLMEMRGKMSQQARMNEFIQLYKEQASFSERERLYDREEAFLSKVRSGDTGEAKKLLNELLGYILMSEGNQSDAVRLHALELATLLSRTALEGGADTDSMFALSRSFLRRIETEQSVQELCWLLRELLEQVMGAMFSQKDKGNPYIRKALRYMSDHYAQPLTLAGVAKEIGLSPSYFSSLFHKVVRLSFREQLCRMRVEESRRLLLSTDYSITEIALAIGFSDQSYYCKVFRRIVGMTPGQYRGNSQDRKKT